MAAPSCSRWSLVRRPVTPDRHHHNTVLATSSVYAVRTLLVSPCAPTLAWKPSSRSPRTTSASSPMRSCERMRPRSGGRACGVIGGWPAGLRPVCWSSPARRSSALPLAARGTRPLPSRRELHLELIHQPARHVGDRAQRLREQPRAFVLEPVEPLP